MYQESEIEEIHENIEVIGYLDGMAIAEDEWGELFYCCMPQEFVIIGEVCIDWDLHPIQELDKAEQEKISAWKGGKENDLL